MLPLLLASSSVYRRELLARLQLAFTCSSPDIDESQRPGELAIDLVKRLAEEKARALAGSHPAHLIIGSDQVAVLGDRIIGKPHTFEKAREQLLASSGASVMRPSGSGIPGRAASPEVKKMPCAGRPMVPTAAGSTSSPSTAPPTSRGPVRGCSTGSRRWPRSLTPMPSSRPHRPAAGLRWSEPGAWIGRRSPGHLRLPLVWNEVDDTLAR